MTASHRMRDGARCCYKTFKLGLVLLRDAQRKYRLKKSHKDRYSQFDPWRYQFDSGPMPCHHMRMGVMLWACLVGAGTHLLTGKCP